MDWNHTWQKYSLQDPYQVLLLFVLTALRSRWLLLLKIEISSIVHCCFSKSQNDQLAMIIHDNFQFHPPCSIGEEDL
jgi:hypothetical protein